jgi:hypothetical protein
LDYLEIICNELNLIYHKRGCPCQVKSSFLEIRGSILGYATYTLVELYIRAIKNNRKKLQISSNHQIGEICDILVYRKLSKV